MVFTKNMYLVQQPPCARHSHFDISTHAAAVHRKGSYQIEIGIVPSVAFFNQYSLQ